MTEKEKMIQGLLYDPSDPELYRLQIRARRLARAYNAIDEEEAEKREAVLKELLCESENIPYLAGPIHFDYGFNTRFGKYCFANFNFICLDVAPITIGENVLMGPNVTLAAPMHPLMAEERNIRFHKDGSIYNLEYAKPIVIEDSCWLAGNVTVCGGVTIHEGAVIGAGSVVTRDIPPRCIAAGSPCRVIRPLTEADYMEKEKQLV